MTPEAQKRYDEITERHRWERVKKNAEKGERLYEAITAQWRDLRGQHDSPARIEAMANLWDVFEQMVVEIMDERGVVRGG